MGARDYRHATRRSQRDGVRRDRPNAYVELVRPVRSRYVRFRNVHVGAATLAVSDIRVFGIDKLPASAFLALSNHPGMSDTLSLFAALYRPDLKIIAFQRPPGNRAPDTDPAGSARTLSDGAPGRWVTSIP